MPREGEDADDILITIAPTLHPSEPTLPPHWQSLLTTLSKLHGEGTRNNYLNVPSVYEFSTVCIIQKMLKYFFFFYRCFERASRN